jgi:DNA-directed RNA polymerase beta subunit
MNSFEKKMTTTTTAFKPKPKEITYNTLFSLSSQEATLSDGQVHGWIKSAFGHEKNFAGHHVASMNYFYNRFLPQIGLLSKPFSIPCSNHPKHFYERLHLPDKTPLYHKFEIIKVRKDNHRENLQTLRACELTQETYTFAVYETILHTIWTHPSCQGQENLIDQEEQEVLSSVLPLTTGTSLCQNAQLMPPSVFLRANFDEGGYCHISGFKYFMQDYVSKLLNYPMVDSSELSNAETKRSTNPNANVVSIHSKSSFAREQMKNIGKKQKLWDQALVIKSKENTTQKEFASNFNVLSSLSQRVSRTVTKKKKYDYSPLKSYLIAEIRSRNNAFPFRSTQNIFVKMGRPNDEHLFGGYTCFVLLQYVQVHIPITVIMMILGVDRLDYIRLMYRMRATLPSSSSSSSSSQQQWQKLWDMILTIHLLQHPKDVQNKEQALRYFACMSTSSEKASKMPLDKIENDFNEILLPHCGPSSSKFQKAVFLARAVYKLILIVTRQMEEDDLSHLSLKRVDTNGLIWANVYRQSHEQFFWKNGKDHLIKFFEGRTSIDQTNRTNGVMSKYGFNWSFMFPGTRIGSRLSQGVATGNFTASKTLKNQRTGICMALNMYNEDAYRSSMARVALPITEKNKRTKPRLYQTSYHRTVCSETNEGERVGLQLTLTNQCQITPFVHPDTLLLLFSVYDIPWTPLKDDVSQQMKGMDVPLPSHFYQLLSSTSSQLHPKNEITTSFFTWIYLNGRPIGYTTQPQDFVDTIKEWRRTNVIEAYTSVVWNQTEFWNEIQIYNEMSRFATPMVVVEKYKAWKKELERGIREKDPKWVILDEEKQTFQIRRSRIDWNAWRLEGIIEFIDKTEEYHSATRIASPTEKNPTHEDIHPYLNLGPNIAKIPWANKNQNPRLTFQSAMGKYASSSTTVMDETNEQIVHSLCYPEKPLVHTDMTDDFQSFDVCTGVYARVLLAGEEDTEEDAAIFNRAFIQRGGGLTQTKRTYTVLCSRSSKKEMIKRPDPKQCLGMKTTEPYQLEENGLPFLGQYIKSNHALVGKVLVNQSKPVKLKNVKMDDICQNVLPQYREQDISQFVANSEGGQVSQIYCNYSSKDNQNVIKIQHTSTNELGQSDKFSSRHGQKNTIQVRSNEDMPFTLDGIPFDVILNPFGFASRMTIGDQNERTLGNLSALLCDYINATTFTDFIDDEEIQYRLKSKGIMKTSLVRVMDGDTGQMKVRPMASGMLYLQILSKHRACVKVQCRSTGPCTILTRQPPDSKSKDGGIRVGNMEKDAFIAHGCAAMVRERMQTTCNEFRNFYCKDCGQPVIANAMCDYFYCTFCQKNISGHTLNMSYDTKLFLQEMKMMYIKASFTLKKKTL